MTDIYERISKDHDNHRQLLNNLAATEGDSPERRKLWDSFYYDVKSHSAAEEETFYSPLMEDPKGQDDARHSVSEHKHIDDIMEELNKMELSSPGWLNRFKTLKKEYEHHMDEEENEIFAKGREVFSAAEAEAFADKFERRKAKERTLVDEKAKESLEK